MSGVKDNSDHYKTLMEIYKRIFNSMKMTKEGQGKNADKQ